MTEQRFKQELMKLKPELQTPAIEMFNHIQGVYGGSVSAAKETLKITKSPSYLWEGLMNAAIEEYQEAFS